jgi:hypothetical protein
MGVGITVSARRPRHTMETMMGTEFSEWLRGRSDEGLRALVAARPELVTPVPAHIEALAARAGTPSAIGRALDRLDQFTLAVLETLALRPGPATRADLRTPLARAADGTLTQDMLIEHALSASTARARTRKATPGKSPEETPEKTTGKDDRQGARQDAGQRAGHHARQGPRRRTGRGARPAPRPGADLRLRRRPAARARRP